MESVENSVSMVKEYLQNTSKLRRTENFTNKEKLLMISILEKYVSITENKAIDGHTCRQKEAAWCKIASSYNISNTGTARTVTQLQSLWKNMKARIRHQSLTYQQKVRSGQSVAPQELIELMKEVFSDNVTEVLPVIQPLSESFPEVQPLYNPYDSDAPSAVSRNDTETANVASNPQELPSLTNGSSQGDHDNPDTSDQLLKMAREEHNMKMILIESKIYGVKRRLQMEEELHAIKVKKLNESCMFS